MSIKVIQGHQSLDFYDRSLKNENFRQNLNGQKIDFKSCNRPHRSRFLGYNLAKTSPSGARVRIWSKFTFNVSMSNNIPNESSWHERAEKIGYYGVWHYKLSKITFFLYLSGTFLINFTSFSANNLYKHKCYDYHNNFNKNFYQHI